MTDPIFEIIKTAKRLGAAFAKDGESDGRYGKYEASLIKLLTTKPTTIEGVAAVLEFANNPEYVRRNGLDFDKYIIRKRRW